MKARFLDEAKAELNEAVRFYNAQRKGLGQEFKKEIRQTVQRIKSLPFGWTQLTDTVRLCQTHRFSYGVIYRVRGHEIQIVAISHLHRKPGYWTHRIDEP